MNPLYWCVFLSTCIFNGCVLGITRDEAGTHCSNVPDTAGTVEICAQCFFPQNCLVNNQCLLGSTGYLCEKCQHHSSTLQTDDLGYFRVANFCTPCLTFPWAIIGVSIFMFLIIANMVYNGLNTSLATKIKQMVDFLQYIILTASIKVPWSSVVTKTAVIFNFSFFSASLATTKCLLHLPDLLELYYLEWGVSVITIIVVITIVKLLDKRSHLQLRKDPPLVRQRSLWRKRSQYRRFAFLILMVFYVPVTVAAIQSFSCTGSLFPDTLTLLPHRELFLYNLNVDCDNITFAGVNSILTLILIFYSCVLPIAVLFFTLRQTKWNLLYSKIIKYGSVYEMYKDRCCWWEFLVMSRKLLYTLLTYTHPLPPVTQAIGHLSITGFMFIITLIIRPYRKFTWKTEWFIKKISPSGLFEVLSTLCILLLDIDAVLTALGMPTAGLDWTFFVLLFITISFWLGCFLAVHEERPIPALEEFEIPDLEKPDSFTLSKHSSESSKITAESQTEVVTPTVSVTESTGNDITSDKLTSSSTTNKKHGNKKVKFPTKGKPSPSSSVSKNNKGNSDDF